MLNPAGLALLADSQRITPLNCQRAIQLFADYDLSVPRLLHPDMLDSRYQWKAGTAYRLICVLLDCGLLTGSRLIRLARDYCWKPGDLAHQWIQMGQAQDREHMVG
jgi:hypothetical protein